MIISASYKTDIPTFYGEWFLNRLNAGFCMMANPYNKKSFRVDLRREAVDGFVFWTKNVTPFLRVLAEVHDRSYPFVVQHTVNGYPRTLEYAVVDAERSLLNIRRIADEYGPRVAVWRYDTIVVSSLTPVDFHLRNFEHLATQLRGAVDEVVISFAHLYRKTLRNMDAASVKEGFAWRDPSVEEKRQLVTRMVEIAGSQSMRLSVCGQREFLVESAADARCVDATRLEDIAGRKINAASKGPRKECGCFASKDIGEYDTCPHGCVYCYAVQDRTLAQRRFANHDPMSEFLFSPDPSFVEDGSSSRSIQLPLFSAE